MRTVVVASLLLVLLSLTGASAISRSHKYHVHFLTCVLEMHSTLTCTVEMEIFVMIKFSSRSNFHHYPTATKIKMMIIKMMKIL